MSDRPDWVSEEIDWRKPSAARVYDVHLGGSHNFEADREVAAQVAQVMPELPALLRANRSFLRRAVVNLVASGVRQFLDLGSGIPTVGNVHEVAQRGDPDCKVVYVDIDSVAVAHSLRILADRPNATAVQGDLRRPEDVLNHPTVSDVLDFSQPIALLMVAVLHFIGDEDDPAGTVRQYVDAVVPGSYLVASHATAGSAAPGRVNDAADLYSRSIDGFYLRDREQFGALLTPVTLIEPGIAYVADWRPDAGGRPDARKLPAFGAVGRKV
jgi:SAM-dependent methyltransferase